MSSQEAATSTYVTTQMTHSALFQKSKFQVNFFQFLSLSTRSIRNNRLFINLVLQGISRMHKMLYNHLIADVDVNVFTEGVAFRETSGAVLHQVKGFQRAKRSQQLLHLRHYVRVKSPVITINHLHPLVQTLKKRCRAC